jgi:CRISPR-associated protein Csd1
LNRTIRDAYFGSAMATPRNVYNRLARLNQVHLRDLKRAKPGAGQYFDQLLMEIAGKMPSDPSAAFPAHATPIQQASFAIGYYHQRQAFFMKKDDTNTPTTDAAAPAATA